MRPPEGWWDGLAFYWHRFTQVALPLWLGCLLVSMVLGYMSYRASHWTIYAYRMKRWGQLTPPPAQGADASEGKQTGYGMRDTGCGMRDAG